MVKNTPANIGDTRDAASILGSERSPGGGHDNPLQYSCLRNSMDRGAWRVTAHGVTKSRSRLSTHTHTHPLTQSAKKQRNWQHVPRDVIYQGHNIISELFLAKTFNFNWIMNKELNKPKPKYPTKQLAWSLQKCQCHKRKKKKKRLVELLQIKGRQERWHSHQNATHSPWLDRILNLKKYEEQSYCWYNWIHFNMECILGNIQLILLL